MFLEKLRVLNMTEIIEMITVKMRESVLKNYRYGFILFFYNTIDAVVALWSPAA
jgi:hypothetical protein